METLYFGKTFDELFDKSFRLFTKGIEEDKFHHYNSSLGMWIYNKEQLKHEMKKRRMLPVDVCEALAEEWDKKNNKDEYGELSPKALDMIKSVKITADRNGNIRLGDRMINALIEIGAINKQVEFKGIEGGFD